MSARILALMVVIGVCVVTWSTATWSQDKPNEPQAEEGQPAAKPAEPNAGPSATDQIKHSAEQLKTKTEGQIKKIAVQLDNNPNAKRAAAGILQPIYDLAELLAFPAFHWVAFALMTTGVFNYALQLVLGKLVVLMRMGFSLKEILSDSVALAISLFGLVLTTQAAVENSTFTQSAAAVISATATGAVLGIILYFWGQSQEIQAAVGRTRMAQLAVK